MSGTSAINPTLLAFSGSMNVAFRRHGDPMRQLTEPGSDG